MSMLSDFFLTLFFDARRASMIYGFTTYFELLPIFSYCVVLLIDLSLFIIYYYFFEEFILIVPLRLLFVTFYYKYPPVPYKLKRLFGFYPFS